MKPFGNSSFITGGWDAPTPAKSNAPTLPTCFVSNDSDGLSEFGAQVTNTMAFAPNEFTFSEDVHLMVHPTLGVFLFEGDTVRHRASISSSSAPSSHQRLLNPTDQREIINAAKAILFSAIGEDTTEQLGQRPSPYPPLGAQASQQAMQHLHQHMMQNVQKMYDTEIQQHERLLRDKLFNATPYIKK